MVARIPWRNSPRGRRRKLTYPEALRSLYLVHFTSEDNEIDHLLSRIGHQLEVLELRNFELRNFRPLFHLMRTAIRGMTRLKELTLFGSVDHRDEAGMEDFVQSVVGLNSLKVLILCALGPVVDEGMESLQDELLKGI
jgi:hypothetical protein